MAEITFRILETFDAVVKYRKVIRAARALHVTPSAVTHSVTKLEKACGVNLIRVRRRGIELTEAGDKIRRQVQLILSLRNSVITRHRRQSPDAARNASVVLQA